ncbi:hypothetical protein [Nocardia alni]|uniref:hypothetical protein n=1 Tax=Nocardia alni TaxID=2815723 RepID=UPI001C21D446|nr:hypothetical protein [Nocardia alni]
MDLVNMVANAVATGAAAGMTETAKSAVTDAYAALKARIVNHYSKAAIDLAAVESEPDEPLRRQLLAKQLDKAGAGADDELREAAQELLRQIAEYAPQAATTVGVQLTHVAAGGDIEIADIAVRGGSGVIATDVTADGSFRVSGVRAGTQEPPHPSPARR